MLTNFVVTTANDVVDANDGEVSLREAVIASNSNAMFSGVAAGEATGDTITFANSLDGSTIVLGSTLTINDDLEITFDGAGITLDADEGNFSIFDIATTERVSLSDMTLQGVRAQKRGGALVLGRDGSLVLENVVFQDNHSFDGGAILMLAGSQLTGENLRFEENLADGGPANGNNGGAIYVGTDGQLALDDSIFLRNFAGRDGGSIATANRTELNLFRVNVGLGDARRRGGGIALGTLSQATITDSAIAQNQAVDGGGIALGYQGKLFGTYLTLSKNQAENTGGGLFAGYESDVLLELPTITENTSQAGGGGIEVKGDSRFTMHFGTVTSNGAVTPRSNPNPRPGEGGGIRLFGSGTSAFIYQSEISENIAESDGGGVWVASGTILSLDESEVERNAARGAVEGSLGGGGIFNRGRTTITGRSSIDENSVNSAETMGGGIFSLGGRLEIAGQTFVSRNIAGSAGGGIAIIDGEASISGAIIGGFGLGTGNTVNGQLARGGGVFISGENGSEVTISGASVLRNIATGSGGGLWNDAGSTLRIQNGAIIQGNTALGGNNNAGWQGGGGIYNNGGFVSINNGVLIEENLAEGERGRGGGINSRGGRVEVYYGSSISFNEATGDLADGGGVAISGGEFVVGNSTIEDNQATDDGGGIHTASDEVTFVRLTNRTRLFSNDAGGNGGGIWNHSVGEVLIDRGTTLQENRAGEDGGGLFNDGGTVRVRDRDTTFFRNTAVIDANGRGGAMFNTASGRLEISDAVISRNIALGNGGGIYTEGFVSLERVRITLNAVQNGSGGGLFIALGAALFDVDSQIERNTPQDIHIVI